MAEVDFGPLMQVLSRPRPNGTAANRETLMALCRWLEEREIPYRIHEFVLYPFFFEAIGAWLLLSRTLLAIATLGHWGWLTFLIAVAGLLGGTLDVALGWPLVSWPGQMVGRNLFMEFGPAYASRELVLSAHYDSKTELLDHRRRAVLQRFVRVGMVLTLVVGALGWAEGWVGQIDRVWGMVVYALAVLLALPVLGLAWALGLNLLLGRFGRQSQGAVDNGAACAILLALAAHLARGRVRLQRTRVVLVLFNGEEQNMQGSRAWVRAREWTLPAQVLNLELMGQDGGYVLWRQDGNAFTRTANDAALSEMVAHAVAEISGEPPIYESWLNSDAFSFHRAGIPATTLGSRDAYWGLAGLHRPADTAARVSTRRLREGTTILNRVIEMIDSGRVIHS
ncbi:MAG: M28 family peptidase [Caldilineae bacterium]|nr:MAG: M28 family peptidase [Caldilineae bacterium]